MFAWYVAAARALLASDDALLLQLWQAALTCTVRVQVTSTVTKLALSAVEASERYVRFADMSDTFMQWAKRFSGSPTTLTESRSYRRRWWRISCTTWVSAIAGLL